MTAAIQLRCPGAHRMLFGRITAGHDPAFRIEIACPKCKRTLHAARVLHVFNAAGQVTSTQVVAA